MDTCYVKMPRHICLVEVGARISLAKKLTLKLWFLRPCNDSLLVISLLMKKKTKKQKKTHSDEPLKRNNLSEE